MSIDHPDLILSDRRSAIMDAARATVAETEQQVRRHHEQRAQAAIADALPLVSRFLEDYGVDPGAGITSGPCTDPAHALAWITTAAGFTFELTIGRHPYVNGDDRIETWLLHPETGARVTRLPSSWEHAASLLVAESVDTIEPEPEVRDHPAERLVDALTEFIDARRHLPEGF